MSEAQQIEEALKQAAEKLAAINLEQNEILTQTQQIVQEINNIKARCDKKRKLIDQENSDKMLIHQKLVLAEKKLEDLQRKYSNKSPPQPQYVPPEPIEIGSILSGKVGQSSGVSQKQERQEQADPYTYSGSSKGEYRPPFELEEEASNKNTKESKESGVNNEAKAGEEHKEEQPQEAPAVDTDANHEDILERIRRNVNLDDDDDD